MFLSCCGKNVLTGMREVILVHSVGSTQFQLCFAQSRRDLRVFSDNLS